MSQSSSSNAINNWQCCVCLTSLHPQYCIGSISTVTKIEIRKSLSKARQKKKEACNHLFVLCFCVLNVFFECF
jgi:hypothetical protein